MSYELFYSEKAQGDLEKIYDYIAFQLLEPEAAEDLCNSILAAAHTLEAYPNRNMPYDHEPWRSRGLRKMTVKHYLILYTVDESRKRVHIHRILYAGRDLDKQLNEN